jgi:hypothetical protein
MYELLETILPVSAALVLPSLQAEAMGDGFLYFLKKSHLNI